MFTLLAPFALIAAALLAIPVIIHLLKPKRVRTMPFSSLRWLRASQHKFPRRIQWHQVLLFLMRAAFLIALVLALAKPIFSTSGKRLYTERFVILDVSRSMSCEEAGKDTPFLHGKKIARALLAQGMPGDRGTMDEFALWERSLSATEIKAMAQQTAWTGASLHPSVEALGSKDKPLLSLSGLPPRVGH